MLSFLIVEGMSNTLISCIIDISEHKTKNRYKTVTYILLYLIYNKVQKILSYLCYEDFISVLISRRYYLLQMILTNSLLYRCMILLLKRYTSLTSFILYIYIRITFAIFIFLKVYI